MITFKCHKCHRVFSVHDSLAGSLRKCNKCFSILSIPKKMPSIRKTPAERMKSIQEIAARSTKEARETLISMLIITMLVILIGRAFQWSVQQIQPQYTPNPHHVGSGPGNNHIHPRPSPNRKWVDDWFDESREWWKETYPPRKTIDDF